MTNDKLVYDNPDNDPAYDEWFERQVDKEITPDDMWDKISAPPTGSFGKMAEVERRLKKKRAKLTAS